MLQGISRIRVTRKRGHYTWLSSFDVKKGKTRFSFPGVNVLPSIIRRGSSLSVPSAIRSLPPSVVSPSSVASVPRLVGRSTVDTSRIRGTAESIRALPKTSPLMSRKVATTTGVVAVSTLAGMGIDELTELLAEADPTELAKLVAAADESGEPSVASSLAEAYNVNVINRASLQPSTEDRSGIVVDQIQRPGIGINQDQVNFQQTLLRCYKSIRSTLSYEDIFTLRMLITTATDDEIVALEDMYRG